MAAFALGGLSVLPVFLLTWCWQVRHGKPKKHLVSWGFLTSLQQIDLKWALLPPCCKPSKPSVISCNFKIETFKNTPETAPLPTCYSHSTPQYRNHLYTTRPFVSPSLSSFFFITPPNQNILKPKHTKTYLWKPSSPHPNFPHPPPPTLSERLRHLVGTRFGAWQLWENDLPLYCWELVASQETGKHRGHDEVKICLPCDWWLTLLCLFCWCVEAVSKPQVAQAQGKSWKHLFKRKERRGFWPCWFLFCWILMYICCFLGLLFWLLGCLLGWLPVGFVEPIFRLGCHQVAATDYVIGGLCSGCTGVLVFAWNVLVLVWAMDFVFFFCFGFCFCLWVLKGLLGPRLQQIRRVSVPPY